MTNQLTFSRQTKNEVYKSIYHLKNCCVDVFLYALFKCLGSLTFTNRGLALSVSTENNDLLNLACKLVKQQYGKSCKIQSENTNSFSGNVIFNAKFDLDLVEKLKLVHYDEQGLLQLATKTNDFFDDNECCRRVFLKTLFLCCGSLSVPVMSDDFTESKKGQRYHMEMVFVDQDFAKSVLDLLNWLGFDFKMTKRKSHTVLYLKKPESIADFLVYLNAMKSKLEIENVMIERNLRNVANRQSNCINANIDKAIVASNKQIEAINLLQQAGKLALLTTQLQDVARLRLAHPEATLEELAVITGISKSGIRHRLDRLVALSKDINQGENK
ncbi:MAG: DNA-binding protein WhiA [Clostridia bacterium]|nr:DNA-binding protein WhiA [Clostridia bacterium]